MPLLACSLLATGCFEDDEDDYTPSACDDFQSEVDAFLSQNSAFSSNPTRSNCNSLKQSAIRMLSKVKDCPGGQGATYAMELWRDIDCNDF